MPPPQSGPLIVPEAPPLHLGQAVPAGGSRSLGWVTAVAFIALSLAAVAVFVIPSEWVRGLHSRNSLPAGAPAPAPDEPLPAEAPPFPRAESEPVPGASPKSPVEPPLEPATSPDPTPPTAVSTPLPIASREPPPAPSTQEPADPFVRAMSEGLEALAREDYAVARQAFERASHLRPGSPQSTDGLARAEAGLRFAAIIRLRETALAQEAQEHWRAAAERYTAVLELDSSIDFAQTGLARSRRRAELSDLLDFHIAHPERLSSEEVLREASGALDKASDIVSVGPRLRRQIEDLGHLVDVYSTPIRVFLESDELTEVVVHHIGQLGKFDRRAIDLRPGTYTVFGSRRGYRDVRRHLVIAPNQVPETLVIRCEEKM